MALQPGAAAAGTRAETSGLIPGPSLGAEKISAILPLKTRGRHYADNVGRCDILFSSLRAFTSPEIFDRIVIVVPHDELAEVRQYAAAWQDFPIVLVDESQHFQVFQDFRARHQVRPWHRQQIIKLFGSQLVDTEYFLVLDPDIFATRHFDLESLLPGGRALTYFQARRREPRFWQASARVLRQDPHLDRNGMWWTPALLSRTLCRSLHRRLAQIYGEDWMRVLLARYTEDWTEYTLYWLNAEREGLLERFHAPPTPGMPQLHTDESVWFSGPNGRNFHAWAAARHFAPGSQADVKGIFAVIQSNTGIPIPAIVQKLQPYLPIHLQTYERYQSRSLQLAEFYSAVTRRMLGKLHRLLGHHA